MMLLLNTLSLFFFLFSNLSFAGRERRGKGEISRPTTTPTPLSDEKSSTSGFLAATTLFPESDVPLEPHAEDLASTLVAGDDQNQQTAARGEESVNDADKEDATIVNDDAKKMKDDIVEELQSGKSEEPAPVDSERDMVGEAETSLKATEVVATDSVDERSYPIDISAGAALLSAIDASTFLNFDTLYTQVYTSLRNGVREALRRIVDEEDSVVLQDKMLSSVVGAAYDDVTAMSMELLFKDTDSKTFWGSLDEAKQSIVLPPLHLLPLFVRSPVVPAILDPSVNSTATEGNSTSTEGMNASAMSDEDAKKPAAPVITEDDTHVIVVTDLLARTPTATPSPVVAKIVMTADVVNNTVTFTEVLDNKPEDVATANSVSFASLAKAYTTLKEEASTLVAHNTTDLEERFYTIRKELGNDGKTYIAEVVAEAEALAELQLEDRERERLGMTTEDRILEISEWQSALGLQNSKSTTNSTAFTPPLASDLTPEVYKLVYNEISTAIQETFERFNTTVMMSPQALHTLTAASLLRFPVTGKKRFQRSYLPVIALLPYHQAGSLVDIVLPSTLNTTSQNVAALQLSGGWTSYPSDFHVFVEGENVNATTVEALVALLEENPGVTMLDTPITEELKMDNDDVIISHVSVLKSVGAPLEARESVEALLSHNVDNVFSSSARNVELSSSEDDKKQEEDSEETEENEDASETEENEDDSEEDEEEEEEEEETEEEEDDEESEEGDEETSDNGEETSDDDSTDDEGTVKGEESTELNTRTTPSRGSSKAGRAERRGRKLQSTNTCVQVSGFQEGCEPINNFGSFGCRTGRDILPAALDGIYRFEGLDLEGWPVFAKPASLEYAQIVNKYMLSRTVQQGIFPDSLGASAGTWATITPNEPTFRLAFENGQIPFAFTPSTSPPRGCTSPDNFPACLDGLSEAWLLVSPETECNGQRASRNTLCSFGRFTITFDVTTCPPRNPNAVDGINSSGTNDFVGTPLSQPTQAPPARLPVGGDIGVVTTRRPFASGGRGPNNDLRGNGRAVGLGEPITYPGGPWFRTSPTTETPTDQLAKSRAAASRSKNTTDANGAFITTTTSAPSQTSLADLLRIEVPWRPTVDPNAPATTTIFPAGGSSSSSSIFPSFSLPPFFDIFSRIMRPSTAESEIASTPNKAASTENKTASTEKTAVSTENRA